MSHARAIAKRPSSSPEPVAPTAMTSRRAQTRQTLLDAAATLFAERGYHETGVPDIVRAAGVSQGTFYQYFAHRRDVLVALAQLAHEAAAGRPPIQGADFGERLRAEIDWYLIESLRYTTLAKVWHDAAAYDRDIASTMRQALAARADQLSVAIRSLDSASALDADVAAAAMVAMIEEFAYRWFVESDGSARSPADALHASRTLSEIVMRALGLG